MMSMHGEPVWVFLIAVAIFVSHFTHPSHSAPADSFVYVGCSQLKYTPGSPYESAVNSVLSSAVNSAALSNYNSFKASLPQPGAAVYALFQCRGDLSLPACRDCVAAAVARLGPSCAGATGGALQLDGCFVRYDNTSFVGDEDKAVVSDRCGPPAEIAGDSDVLARRDAVLSYLAGGAPGQFYRVAGSGKVQGVAQCTQDMSPAECQDCLSEAVQRLRSQCGSSPSGDMFLAKCYARYALRGYTSSTTGNDDEVEKTLAIFIGLVAAVALLIVFLTFLSRLFQRNKGGK